MYMGRSLSMRSSGMRARRRLTVHRRWRQHRRVERAQQDGLASTASRAEAQSMVAMVLNCMIARQKVLAEKYVSDRAETRQDESADRA
jgi:hypothetical protein